MDFQELSDFQFELPEDQIAKNPASSRDQSKLLVLDRSNGEKLEEKSFDCILKYLVSGDVLVVNNTKVSKRRVYLLSSSGRRHEALFLGQDRNANWKALVRNSRKLKIGEILRDEKTGSISFILCGKEKENVLLSAPSEFTEETFDRIGQTPIPPYFKRESTEEDDIRYQTVYARGLGSVAAPTAGLHFTPELIKRCKDSGIQFLELELKVGYGTFQPLTEENFQSKSLHEESYFLPEQTASKLNQARAQNRRIISVGTTTLRVLETAYDPSLKMFRAGEGKSTLFLQPEDRIESSDGLITNFHLPQSSLLLLVCAFAKKEWVLSAYKYAISNHFRFFSYGDAMLILKTIQHPT
ncbi:tRNA preQ1(34) S-adenosylmethionine ribosyltransferase-isomerase QueA [Leptospira perolatii]|uniref:S-adenosylmethionine:tRNA ribosyltransferase-isomerase n=1 Tax=Leptospira perolatii TaxID=2023191 RepID=A0A2M9ZPN7_9LEPT|nr:tRNA preQ1(34) S-adenosylmethionine ribosyltransferase-isomerase QueA [Leptospira perolatii]PJZ70913.1 tRNA preQ1(34) S-adenosylmethionine ribosyltransferase-isomerase QueA [Leptospira perolatii]PJZ74036.1 tRNA preQ1(34) S-adenosylmethionine ribosyltransferase-isomerase QueA [Leptospira perolatii]